MHWIVIFLAGFTLYGIPDKFHTRQRVFPEGDILCRFNWVELVEVYAFVRPEEMSSGCRVM